MPNNSTYRQGDNFLMFILSMPNCKSSECTVHFWLTHQCLGLWQWRVLHWIFLHSWYGKNENHLPYQCMLSIPHFCCNIYTSREYMDVWDDIGTRIVREIIVITVNIVILTYDNRYLDSSFKTFLNSHITRFIFQFLYYYEYKLTVIWSKCQTGDLIFQSSVYRRAQSHRNKKWLPGYLCSSLFCINGTAAFSLLQTDDISEVKPVYFPINWLRY